LVTAALQRACWAFRSMQPSIRETVEALPFQVGWHEDMNVPHRVSVPDYRIVVSCQTRDVG